MKAVKIKINQKKISSKVNKFQLKWAIKFLRRKIKNTQSNVEIKVEPAVPPLSLHPVVY